MTQDESLKELFDEITEKIYETCGIHAQTSMGVMNALSSPDVLLRTISALEQIQKPILELNLNLMDPNYGSW